uniref:Uncharacterized protein n=1 Tax=Rhizophora mucronata TaxID=61149 RepID=A0A2P2Q903_RHIMU
MIWFLTSDAFASLCATIYWGKPVSQDHSQKACLSRSFFTSIQL